MALGLSCSLGVHLLEEDAVNAVYFHFVQCHVPLRSSTGLGEDPPVTLHPKAADSSPADGTPRAPMAAFDPRAVSIPPASSIATRRGQQFHLDQVRAEPLTQTHTQMSLETSEKGGGRRIHGVWFSRMERARGPTTW